MHFPYAGINRFRFQGLKDVLLSAKRTPSELAGRIYELYGFVKLKYQISERSKESWKSEKSEKSKYLFPLFSLLTFLASFKHVPPESLGLHFWRRIRKG
jgi:hypothetical protein